MPMGDPQSIEYALSRTDASDLREARTEAARLRAELNLASGMAKAYGAEIERLRAALKPFAEIGAALPGYYSDDVLWPTQEAGILSGHLRSAAKAFTNEQSGDGK